MAFCFDKCGNPSTPLPIPPDPWNPGPVIPPTPVLTLICPVSPISAICGSAPLPVSANGSLITATTVPYLDGITALPVVTFSPTSLTFTVDPTNELTPRIAQISLRDGAETAIATCPFEFTSAVIRPTLTYVFPDNIGTEDAVRTGLKLTGLNFDATSVVVLDQKDCVTRLVSPTELSFDTYAPASNNTGSGTYNLRVRNGGVPEGYSVNTIPFYVSRNPKLWPGPTGTLTPATIPAGSPGPVSVKVAGYDLNGKTVATVDGVMVPTTGQNGSIMFFEVDPSTVAPGTVMQIGAVTGHQHPEGHDNVVIITPPLTWPLSFT